MSKIWIVGPNKNREKFWTVAYLFLLFFAGIFIIGKLYFSLFYEVGKMFFKKERWNLK